MRSAIVEQRPSTWRLAIVALSFAGMPASAQDADMQARTTRMIEDARDYFGTRRSLTGCQSTAADDEIVICALPKPDMRFRPIEPLRPREQKMIALGAPPVGGGVGVSVTMRGCFLQACPKDFYIIDVKAIPEPAPGSEAYLIARGEAPAR